MIQEVNQLLKKANYSKAFKILSSREIIHMRVARRFVYCCNKLLKRYLSKYSRKSHHIKPILVRSFDGLQIWAELIHKEETVYQVRSMRRMSSMSPTQSSFNWLKYQKLQFLQQFTLTLRFFYQHLKLTQYTASTLVLKKLLLFSYFTDSLSHLSHQNILERQKLMLLIGNGYFELCSLQKAAEYYMLAIKLGAERIVLKLLHEKQQEKISVQDKKFQYFMKISVSNTIIALDGYSNCMENQTEYSTAIKSEGFADYLCSILLYFKSYQDLVAYIYARHEFLYKRYYDYLQETFELNKITELIFNYNKQKIEYKHEYQDTYQQLLQKFKHKDNQQPYIVQIDADNYEQETSNKKILSEGSAYESTVLSGRNSKCSSEFNFQQDKNGITYISIPSLEIGNYKRFPHKVTRKKQLKDNYLSQLLKMNQNIVQKSQSKPVSRRSSFMTLDQEMKYQISQNLHIEDNQQKIQELLRIEQDLQKEIPQNYNMLKFKKEFGNGQMVKENIEEFNKHFEFNIMKYFDYLVENKTSAMTYVESNKNFKKLRLAEQKLIQSKNLVVKQQVDQPTTDRNKEDKKVEIEDAANKLLKSIHKKKLISNEDILRRNALDQNEVYQQQKESMKRAFNQKLLIVSLDDPGLEIPKDDGRLNKQYQELKQQRQIHQQANSYNKAQEGIKQLLMNFEQKDVPPPLCPSILHSKELASSVKVRKDKVQIMRVAIRSMLRFRHTNI